MSDGPPVHLEVIPSRALEEKPRVEIINLCESAYGEDFTQLFESLPEAVHVLARDEQGVLVSHAEFVTRWLQPAGHPVLRAAYVEAVATAPARQRQGLATAVLRRIHELIAADPSWELGALSPSTPTLYARLGWELWKGPLAVRRGDGLEPTPAGEQVMILRLPPTPPTLVTTTLLSAEWRAGELW